MTKLGKAGLREFVRAQMRARELYRLKDPQYGSVWKKSLVTWGPSFLGMRLQEDVSKLVSLLKSKPLDDEAVVDTLLDIQVYSVFGLIYFDSLLDSLPIKGKQRGRL